MMKPSTLPETGWPCLPYDPSLHYALGLALAQKGDLITATNQFAYALLLGPDGLRCN